MYFLEEVVDLNYLKYYLKLDQREAGFAPGVGMMEICKQAMSFG